MNEDRLTQLADFLQTVPAERFDMSHWGYSLEGECDFAGCAIGWATTIPEFKAEGFGREPDYEIVPAFQGWSSWAAVEAFFNIDSKTAHYLFEADEYPSKHTSPVEVAERIHALIAKVPA